MTRWYRSRGTPAPVHAPGRAGSRRGARLVGLLVSSVVLGRLLALLLARDGAVHPSRLASWSLAPERYAFQVGCVRVVDGPCDPGDPDGIEARTVEWMDQARHSLHAALYELSLPSVTATLIGAHQRGLDVRVHAETDGLESGSQRRCLGMLVAAGIPVTFDGRASLMHDKFVVRDGGGVWTGAANLTWPGVHLHYNEAVLVEDARVASLYEREFARLQAEAGGLPDPAPEERGVAAVDAPGLGIRVAFAPEGPREALFLGAIAEARREIRVAAFSLTHRGLVAALAERAAAGVRVEVILDGRNARSGPAQEAVRCLGNAGCRVSTASGRPPADLVARFGLPRGQDIKIHHKLLVVDERVVVTGSANLSANGFDHNDENVLRFDSEALAEKYTWVLDRARAACARESP